MSRECRNGSDRLTHHHVGTLQSRRGTLSIMLQTAVHRTVHSPERSRAQIVSSCSAFRISASINLDTVAPQLTLNAKFLSAFATPGFGSNLLPALIRKVTAEVGWLWSTAATFRPAESTTVANVRPRRDTFRTVDALAASIWIFVKTRGEIINVWP